MSYYFKIEKTERLQIKDLLKGLGVTNVKYTGERALNEDSELLWLQTFYIPYKSTCGVVVIVEGDTIKVNINPLSSKTDYIMAIKLTKNIAKIFNSEIIYKDEENTPMSILDFETKFDEKWINLDQKRVFSIITGMVEELGTTIELQCCRSNFDLGPKTLKQLSIGNQNEEILFERVIKSILRVQYLDIAIIKPTLMYFGDPVKEYFSVLTIASGIQQLMSRAKYVVLVNSSTYESVQVHYELFNRYASLKFERLDESKFIIPEINSHEFTNLIDLFSI